mgnify:CR=1 FL=1
MRRLAIAVALTTAFVVYAAGRSDGQFTWIATLRTAGSGSVCTAVPPGAYIRVGCVADAIVCVGTTLADAGSGDAKCTLDDAGYRYPLVKFSAGATFNSQLVTPANRVCVMDLGTPTDCVVGKSIN